MVTLTSWRGWGRGGGGLSSAARRCGRGTPDCCGAGVDKAQRRGGSVLIDGRDREAAVSGPMARRHASSKGPRRHPSRKAWRVAAAAGTRTRGRRWDQRISGMGSRGWWVRSTWSVGNIPPARRRTSPSGSANW
jgi:hypothetical protein